MEGTGELREEFEKVGFELRRLLGLWSTYW